MPPFDGFRTALVAEAMKKTGVCWVRWPGDARDHAVWHVWHDGAAYVISGPGEQPLPGSGQTDTATVTTRTKDSRARLVVWRARARVLPPRTQEWEEAAELLQAGRLNLTDPDHVRDRWAAECTVTELTPTGETDEGPGSYPDDDLAAAPLPTAATTRGVLPRVLHRRQANRPKLR